MGTHQSVSQHDVVTSCYLALCLATACYVPGSMGVQLHSHITVLYTITTRVMHMCTYSPCVFSPSKCIWQHCCLVLVSCTGNLIICDSTKQPCCCHCHCCLQVHCAVHTSIPPAQDAPLHLQQLLMTNMQLSQLLSNASYLQAAAQQSCMSACMINVACCMFSLQACNTAHRSITGYGNCM
jgi:hypothetical protein